MKHTKKPEKKKDTLSKDKMVNKTRLRDGIDIVTLRQGL